MPEAQLYAPFAPVPPSIANNSTLAPVSVPETAVLVLLLPARLKPVLVVPSSVCATLPGTVKSFKLPGVLV